MARILVTGGTGYIGSHTVVELMQQGYDVVIVDNLSNSDQAVLDGIAAIVGTRPDFVQADCCDSEAINALFTRYNDIVGVIHFAASKAVSYPPGPAPMIIIFMSLNINCHSERNVVK